MKLEKHVQICVFTNSFFQVSRELPLFKKKQSNNNNYGKMSSFLLFYIFNILLILKILFIYLVEDIKHCYIEIEIKPLWYCNNRNNKNKKVLIPRKRLG